MKKQKNMLLDIMMRTQILEEIGVKTEKIEVLDCFLALEEEADVQEIYSSFYEKQDFIDRK